MNNPRKLLHNKTSAREVLDVGATKLNELIAAGLLETVSVGGCVRITDESLQKLAKNGDGIPLTRGWNVIQAARASALARQKRRAEREAAEAASTHEEA
jgi:hypothetical protein